MPPSARQADKTTGAGPSLTELAERALSWWTGELRAMVPVALLARAPSRPNCPVDLFLDGDGTLTMRAGDKVEYFAGTESLGGIMSHLQHVRGRSPAVRLDVPRGFCLIRKSILPRRALRDARRLMMLETAENTPLMPEDMYADWYVESEEPETRRLHIRHVLLARERVASIRRQLEAEGLTVARLTVGHGEGRPLPVDLLSCDEPGLRAFLRMLSWPARLGFALAIILTCTLPFLLADRVERETSVIQDQRAEIIRRLQSIPGAAPAALDLARMPPAAEVLDEIAARLPQNATLQSITLADGKVGVTLAAGEIPALLQAMAGSAVLLPAAQADPGIATFTLGRSGGVP